MPTAITEYTGTSATHKLPYGNITYSMLHGPVEDSEYNLSGMMEHELAKYEDAFYFTLYFNTVLHMYYPTEYGYIQSYAQLEANEMPDVQTVLATMYADMVALNLTDSLTQVYYDDIVVQVTDNEMKLRPSELILVGLMRIKENDGSVNATTTTTVLGKTMAKYSTAQYDYYLYGNSIIQVPIGTSLEGLISFTEEK